MGKIGKLMVGFLVFELLLSALLINPLSSTANPLTEVTIDLQDEPPEVDVSPGSSGIVTATGIVTCEKWGPDQVKVSLTGNSSYGGASVIPPNMVFGGSGGSEEVRTFAVTTKVPTGTSCYETGTIIVCGNYIQGGMQYNIDPDSVNIIILQYYLASFEDEKEKMESLNYSAKAGSDLGLRFYLKNEGNGNDAFSLDFVNREALEDRGFDLPNPIDVTLVEKGKEEIRWEIEISDDISGTYHTEIQATSKVSGEIGTPYKLILPVTIHVEEQGLTDKIGSILISPLVIGIILVVVMVGIIVKIRS